jgi:hypothetical protein
VRPPTCSTVHALLSVEMEMLTCAESGAQKRTLRALESHVPGWAEPGAFGAVEAG